MSDITAKNDHLQRIIDQHQSETDNVLEQIFIKQKQYIAPVFNNIEYQKIYENQYSIYQQNIASLQQIIYDSTTKQTQLQNVKHQYMDQQKDLNTQLSLFKNAFSQTIQESVDEVTYQMMQIDAHKINNNIENSFQTVIENIHEIQLKTILQQIKTTKTKLVNKNEQNIKKSVKNNFNKKMEIQIESFYTKLQLALDKFALVNQNVAKIYNEVYQSQNQKLNDQFENQFINIRTQFGLNTK